MKTYMAKKGEVQARWYLVDATEKVLGRLASAVATILMGKHRPQYTPHVDTGEFVVIVNAAKAKLTGDNKQTDRIYARYSRHPGGYKETPLGEMFARHPELVVSEAIRRMLPKTKLGRHMFSKLKVYAGPEHPHQAQQPQPLEL